jgi:4-hydroxythreonine-4-phosphate dehydrogenase
MSPRIAVTVGDPRGIGPEVAARVLADPPADADYVVIGPEEIIAGIEASERIAVDGNRESGIGNRNGRESGIGNRESSHQGDDVSPFSHLDPRKHAGLLTALSVEKAVALALSGEVDAIVTGPAEKRALRAAGYDYPGHTEWLAALAGGVEVAMMLQAGALRVVMLTTHIPLRAVPDAVTGERILSVGAIAHKALADWWNIAKPRLAVCALNPHAGEGGMFGDEDERVLAPAARELGAAGPFPADTVFVRALRGEFDAVLTPSHDVGMTAVKVAGFGSGVNVTLGLPFIRTAPDHGTALDIAGKGVADPGSMREAVKVAVELATRRVERESGSGNRES